MNEDTALIVSPQSRPMALSVDEMHGNLEFIRTIMNREMREGQDYGKIPGCGDKPALLQPGAQKLCMVFMLTSEVKKEIVRELPHPIWGHREYDFTVSLISGTGKRWDGVGSCSTFEAKYRWRKGERLCPECGKAAIIKENPQYVKLPQIPGWVCWKKKEGCGMRFPLGDKAITDQQTDRVEHDNPADYWNTVRKMAFKRALVHAAINATNTSDLWTQDIEDLPQAEVAIQEPVNPEPKSATPKPIPTGEPTPKWRMAALNKLQAAPGQANRNVVAHFLMVRGFIKADQQPEDWELKFVPKTAEELTALSEEIQKFGMQQAQSQPYSETP